MNFRSSAIGLPLILRSHIISLIKPMASVVLASSKNTTVSMLALVLSTDSRSACWINLAMSSSVVPPWTYCNHINIFITHIDVLIQAPKPNVLVLWLSSLETFMAFYCIKKDALLYAKLQLKENIVHHGNT